MTKYVVLRNLAAVRTSEPFTASAASASTAALDISQLGMAGVRIDVEQLEKSEVRSLARDPEVLGMAPPMPTQLIRPVDESSGEETATSSVAWGVPAVGADRSPRTGAGVTVAVLDTGIDASHPAFTGIQLVQKDFTGSGDGDKDGHGTHCAGTIFGRDVDGTRIGVAPGVSTALIGKVLGDDGSGDSDMIFKGIQWALENGAHVISMSVEFDFPGLVARMVDEGLPVDLATSLALENYRANLRMFDALMGVVKGRAAFTPGTVLVAASGNASKRDIDPRYEIAVALPAAAEGVISVGALGKSSDGLRVAPFSNTFPQVSGPGVDVLSAKAGGGLATLSGTSMAAPHVAGCSALWWEEVKASPLPTSALAVTAKLLATASTRGIAADVDIADRGVGMIQAP